MNLWMTLLQAIYFMLPAFIANMAPVFSSKAKFMQVPLDEGKKLGKHRLLGDHKTVGGLLFGVVFGMFVMILQIALRDVAFFKSISLFYYEPRLATLLLGFMLMSGALLGDLVKSFFKRRVNIQPGKPWIPFDQLDFVFGSLALGALIFFPGWKLAGIILVVSFVLHILTNVIGYWIGVRKQAV
jgi:CDP-2,3-bis-(O-geranylgeranyl)-sn-glycerol synthase